MSPIYKSKNYPKDYLRVAMIAKITNQYAMHFILQSNMTLKLQV